MNTIAIITIKLDQRVNLNLGLKNGTDSTFQEQNKGSIFLLKKALGKIPCYPRAYLNVF